MFIIIERPYREEAHTLNLKGKDHLRGLGVVILRKEKVWEHKSVFIVLCCQPENRRLWTWLRRIRNLRWETYLAEKQTNKQTLKHLGFRWGWRDKKWKVLKRRHWNYWAVKSQSQMNSHREYCMNYISSPYVPNSLFSFLTSTSK